MPQFYPLTVAEVIRETNDAVIVTFHVPEHLQDTFRYIQGQHLILRREFDDVEQRRNYSICSSVEDNCLRIAIKKIPHGLFSNFANDELQAGDVLEAMPPTGNFYQTLDANKTSRYLAFAAGSGITPILSIIKTTLETELESLFTLVYANRDTANIIFLEQLEGLKNQHQCDR